MWLSVDPGNITAMKHGLDISPAGAWGRPDEIAELATLAEDHGWDGVFCEDYLAFPGGLPTYDVWVTLGLVAQATTRLTLGTMVTPVPPCCRGAKSNFATRRSRCSTRRTRSRTTPVPIP